MLRTAGYQQTLIVFGIILGIIGMLAGLGLRSPHAAASAPAASALPTTTAVNTPPPKMLQTPIFWLLFAMMTMMSTGGLMVISQFAAFSRDFGVADVIVLGFAKHATTNCGFLYLARGIGSVLGGPIAALLHDGAASWLPVFALIIVMDVLTAILALFVLKPMRRRWLRSNEAMPTGVALAAADAAQAK